MPKIQPKKGLISTLKSLFSSEKPYYERLSDGSHNYSYSTSFFDLIRFGKSYYRPNQNYKNYYLTSQYLGSCIDLIADMASNIEIKEVHAITGEDLGETEFIKMLKNPNNFQTGQELIREAAINYFTTGILVQNGNFFRNGNLKVLPRLFNLEFCNLKFPKIPNPYEVKRSDLSDFKIIETLENGRTRILLNSELITIYDRGKNGTFGNIGYSGERFFSPISRVGRILYDLQILENTLDSMAFISHKPVMGILSKNAKPGELGELAGEEKEQIERSVNGNGQYGASLEGKGSLIATNADLKLLDISPNTKKLMLIEMQNNAKENIRSEFQLPRDLKDDVSGDNRGSTYENQQFAEARAIENIPKPFTDSWLEALQQKCALYFKNNNSKLVGSYDHFPAMIAIKSKLKNEGLKAQQETLKILLENATKAKEAGITLNIENYLKENGFEDLL